jgi:hypothetical protein
MVAKGGGAFLRPQTASRKGWKIGRVPQIPLLEPGIAQTSASLPYASQGFTNDGAISSKCFTFRVAKVA